MGLDVSVGLLGAFLEDEAHEGFRPYTENVAAVNATLRAAGLAPFTEPPPDGIEPVQLTLGPTSGLQALRRVAAHVWAGDGVPAPGDDPPESDPVLVRYYKSRGADGAADAPRFDHLVLHSDFSGYYVPLDFEQVLTPAPSSVLAGEVGSSQRLGEELARLTEILALPAGLDPDGEELWSAYEGAAEAGAGWQRHGVEAFVCVRLEHACRASVRDSAMLVFS